MATKAIPRKKKKDTKRSFSKDVLLRARAIVDKYQIIVAFEDGEYYGRGLEYPTAFGDGKTVEACMESTRAGLVAAVATNLEDGIAPPPPASENARTLQINIRVSAEEKLRMETLASQRGFKGVADYVRAMAMSD